ncbi:MAG: AAA family ATPase [Actinomycetota bacterium]
MGSAGAPIGREGEVHVLRDFLEDAAAFPDILQIEGDAGIGKTTLWRCGLELAVAHSYRVLSCSPSGAETQLSFAGLGDMLETVTDEVLSDLPPPLARALSIALLLEDAAPSPPDQRAIGLALLGGIRALARDGPLVIAVDDMQWLDDASGLTLGFALRRISEEPVGVLLARRTGGEEGPSGPGLELGPLRDRDLRLVMEPLSMGAIHHLLGERLGLTLTRPNARRLYEVSGGNPFYALELGRAVVRGAIDLESGGPLPRSLSSLVADRIASTSEPTRHALLIVSALSHPTMGLIARAGVEAPTERLAPALETHVIEFENERIRFSHPLLAAGVYSAALPLERRAVHRRLADVVTDPEEQARHVALGAEGPDPAIAAVLEDSAVRTHARGRSPRPLDMPRRHGG